MRTAPPEPLGPVARIILGAEAADEIEARARFDYERRLAADATVSSARALAAMISASTNAAYDDVWDELLGVPDNLLPLFATPEGWATLSAHVAIQCGCGAAVVRPATH